MGKMKSTIDVKNRMEFLVYRMYEPIFDLFAVYLDENGIETDYDDEFHDMLVNWPLGIKGYETTTWGDIDINQMPYEDIVNIYNFLEDTNLTIESISKNEDSCWYF